MMPSTPPGYDEDSLLTPCSPKYGPLDDEDYFVRRKRLFVHDNLMTNKSNMMTNEDNPGNGNTSKYLNHGKQLNVNNNDHALMGMPLTPAKTPVRHRRGYAKSPSIINNINNNTIDNNNDNNSFLLPFTPISTIRRVSRNGKNIEKKGRILFEEEEFTSNTFGDFGLNKRKFSVYKDSDNNNNQVNNIGKSDFDSESESDSDSATDLNIIQDHLFTPKPTRRRLFSSIDEKNTNEKNTNEKNTKEKKSIISIDEKGRKGLMYMFRGKKIFRPFPEGEADEWEKSIKPKRLLFEDVQSTSCGINEKKLKTENDTIKNIELSNSETVNFDSEEEETDIEW